MSETASTCPNCGAPRAGRFCVACGQNDRSYLRATREIVGDVLSEVFDFDSRLGRTLKALLLRPGFLSSEFSSDRRARYVSPVRLYFIVSVVFFGVLSLTTRLESDTVVHVAEPARAEQDAKADPDIAHIYSQLNAAQRARLKAVFEKQGIAGDSVTSYFAELDKTNRAAPAQSVSAFESTVGDRLLDLAEDPRAAYQKVIADLPAAMFCTLPLYAVWLKLLYRRRFYSEHLAFALHLHSFLFFIGTFILVLPDAPSQSASGVVRALVRVGETAGGVLQITGLAYYVVALKHFYLESWKRTVAKFFAVNAAHAITSVVTIGLVAMVALVLY